MEAQILCLQLGLALTFCVAATTGALGGSFAVRMAAVGWIATYHAFHAWYVLAYRMRGLPSMLVELVTPALDVSCIGFAWVATGDPGSPFWAVYAYALMGYARRIHGRAYIGLTLFVVVNLVAARVAIGSATGDALFNANAAMMVAITVCAAGLAHSIGSGWRKAENQARALAETDALTGIPNRRKFLLWLDELAGHPATEFSVLMLDLDDFKRLNDEHGHLHGDDVLARVARTLEANIAPSHRLARYGGEEFVVALPGADLAEARARAEVLRLAVGSETPATVSIGCAARLSAEPAGSVMRRADDQLLAAKRTGKNTVRADTALRRVA